MKAIQYPGIPTTPADSLREQSAVFMVLRFPGDSGNALNLVNLTFDRSTKGNRSAGWQQDGYQDMKKQLIFLPFLPFFLFTLR